MNREPVLNPSTDGADLFTMEQAASRKGVSYHTVSRAVRSGVLPARRLGRQALIAAADVENWRPQIERRPHKYQGRSGNPTTRPTLRSVKVGDETVSGPSLTKDQWGDILAALDLAARQQSVGAGHFQALAAQLRRILGVTPPTDPDTASPDSVDKVSVPNTCHA